MLFRSLSAGRRSAKSCAPFVLSEMPLILGQTAKMFGVLPSTLLDQTPLEMGVNVVCMQALRDEEERRIRSLPKGSLTLVKEV